MKKTLTVVLTILLAIGFTACSDDDSSSGSDAGSLIGTWYFMDGTTPEKQLIFNSNNTYSENYTYTGGAFVTSNEDTKGTWSYSGYVLTMTETQEYDSGEWVDTDYVDTEKFMVANIDQKLYSVYLRKDSSSGLTGTWGNYELSLSNDVVLEASTNIITFDSATAGKVIEIDFEAGYGTSYTTNDFTVTETSTNNVYKVVVGGTDTIFVGWDGANLMYDMNDFYIKQ